MGRLETLRPSMDSDSGYTPFTNPANAYDGNTSTSSYGIDSDLQHTPAVLVLEGFPAPAASATAGSIKLKTVSKVAKYGTGTVSASLSYSLDAGASWTTIYDVDGDRAKTTDEIVLSSVQNFSTIRVKFQATWISGTQTYVNSYAYEAWIEVAS